MDEPPAVSDTIRWILTEGRAFPTIRRFISALCRRLLDQRVPLWRVTIYAATLHPQIRGFGWRWWRDRGVTEEVRVAQGVELTGDYQQSPLRRVIETGVPLRRRLDAAAQEYPLLAELHRDGGTDYLAVPLNQVGRRFPVLAWATDRPGGFAAADLDLLEAIRPAVAAVVEAAVVRRTARSLFSIYHGRHVGDRVFDGQILRGSVDLLRAAVMATDLRGFTGISDRLPGDEVVQALDEYFEMVTQAVHAQGGNVLKFIGDGVLAIFDAEEGEDAAAADAGLAAARALIRHLDARNAGEGRARVPLRAGVGLHLGTVMYGNVGAPDRLDFTAIGPAVNLAFRLEDLTKELRRPVLASRAFAAAASSALTPLGPQPIRGLSEYEEVFGLPEHGALAAQ
ncbi:MAG TPA: adenylate/guanylate cyclase domain-containing protein [Stellaceae bacterium]|nr:adenylate/guanylate cyclase domain-containing protein [Stellaceae bacterium]